MFLKLGLFVNSAAVLVESNRVDYDRHEAVINSAKLAALTIERSSAVQVEANLV